MQRRSVRGLSAVLWLLCLLPPLLGCGISPCGIWIIEGVGCATPDATTDATVDVFAFDARRADATFTELASSEALVIEESSVADAGANRFDAAGEP